MEYQWIYGIICSFSDKAWPVSTCFPGIPTWNNDDSQLDRLAIQLIVGYPTSRLIW